MSVCLKIQEQVIKNIFSRIRLESQTIEGNSPVHEKDISC